jgi:hypothetical protein
VRVVLAPIAETVKHRSASGIQSIPHHLIAVEGDERGPETAHMVTVVVFEVVDSPCCKALCILCLPIQRARFEIVSFTLKELIMGLGISYRSEHKSFLQHLNTFHTIVLVGGSRQRQPSFHLEISRGLP